MTMWILPNSKQFLKAGLALFLLGFTSFSLVYCIQPLLPELTQTFAVSATQSSLALSLTTCLLALSILLSSAFSQALGRKGFMFCCILIAALLNFLCALVPSWSSFLLIRTLEGFILGGIPAVALAWASEEVHPEHISKIIGLYVSGSAFGGMVGRVGMGIITQYLSWRIALGILGILCFCCAFSFYYLLPASKNFTAHKGKSLFFHLRIWKNHLATPTLLKLYGLGFLLTSIFSGIFNYMTFRLSSTPYHLNTTQVSLIFLFYVFGIVSSSLTGKIADHIGQLKTLYLGFFLIFVGSLFTLNNSLFWILVGIAHLTTGFFMAHTMASSRVSITAQTYKGHATSLYLLFYYLGSSTIGSLMGLSWQAGGWHAVIMTTSALMVVVFLILWSKSKVDQRQS